MMSWMLRPPIVAATIVALSLSGAWASDYIEAEIETDLVPSPVKFAVLLPDGYQDAKEPYPLLLWLHGGGGDRDTLKGVRSSLDGLWRDGRAPEMVVVTPTVKPTNYLDALRGSPRWETFLIGPFLEHLRTAYKVRSDRGGTLIGGISMGGLGSLRIAFKHPELFAAVAAMEPAIYPALKWREVAPESLYETRVAIGFTYGSPVDEKYWEANNPASIASAQAERLRASGLEIYIEVGDEDELGLHEGAEFLHQTLWRNRIRHEYHLVRGGRHVGRTVAERAPEKYEFLSRVLNPPAPDPAVERLEARVAEGRQQAGVPPAAFWPNEPVPVQGDAKN
jgi:S-formylglutathione hydrolase